MLKVSEITKLTLFHEFELICGEQGLSNTMNSIVILEYEPISQNYDVFHEGDFVLTSLFFAREQIDLIVTSFKELIKRKISGLAIKTVFFDDIPEEVKQLARLHQIPIFLFHHAYMEDLILSANELLKTKLQFLVFEEKITNLIQTRSSSYDIENTLKEIHPDAHPNIITAYITSKNTTGSTTILSYFHRLIYKKYSSYHQYSCSYVKYKSGMILIYSFPDHTQNSMESFSLIVEKQLKHIDINPEYFYIGISDFPTNHKNLDVSIKQAIYANYISRLEKKTPMHYSGIGVYQLLTPLIEDDTTKARYLSLIETLKNYDEKYTSDLLATMIIYIKNNGDIAKTATEIFQHPNTARYRLKKVVSLLELDENNYYEQLYIIIKLYLLHIVAIDEVLPV